VIILGLGFTGQRVARRLLVRGVRVFAAVRDAGRFGELARAGLLLSEMNLDRVSLFPHLPRRSVLIHCIPPLAEPENLALRALIEDLNPRRIVYVSSTNVYGEQRDVNEETPVHPGDERGHRRVEEERWIASGPWSSLILRSAAIYGPGRGVHAALREGRIPRSAGSGMVSRIHVEDLAAMIEAGIASKLEGAWPIADELPCASAEIAAWCIRTMNLSAAAEIASPFRITGRRVDGRRVRELLGVSLTYPSWETGIPASMAEEEKNKA
jgi:nucleoside-diphosphate-sugar epimerase